MPMTCVRFLGQYIGLTDWVAAKETAATCPPLYLMRGAAALLVGRGVWRVFTYDGSPRRVAAMPTWATR